MIPQYEELFSFGSGGCVKDGEATDVMSDLGGRWLRFDLTGLASESLAILENSRKLPEHLKDQDFFNKACK